MLYKRFAGKLFSQLHCIEIGHGFIAMKIQIFIFMFVKLVCAINVSITKVLLLGWESILSFQEAIICLYSRTAVQAEVLKTAINTAPINQGCFKQLFEAGAMRVYAEEAYTGAV